MLAKNYIGPTGNSSKLKPHKTKAIHASPNRGGVFIQMRADRCNCRTGSRRSSRQARLGVLALGRLSICGFILSSILDVLVVPMRPNPFWRSSLGRQPWERKRTNMKTSKLMAPQLLRQPVEIAHKSKSALVALGILSLALVSGSTFAAEKTGIVPAEQPSGLSGAVSTSQPVRTNLLVGQIQKDLEALKLKLAATVNQVREAAGTNQAHHALMVSNVAVQIRGLASELEDGKPLMGETTRLVEKFKTQINHGRGLAANPSEEAREIYETGVTKAEQELAELLNERSSVSRVRAELLRQANNLESKAKAIGWLEDLDDMMTASRAFGDLLREFLAFAGRIDDQLTKLGAGQAIAVE